MRSTKITSILLALCLMFTVFTGCSSDKNSGETQPTSTECEHEFKDGYCTKCEKLDPDCTELTAENYEDYLKIGYKVIDTNGKTNTVYATFVSMLMSVSPTSDRCTFYNVTINMEVTVKLALAPSGFEDYTTTVEIPVALFGEGETLVHLDRESYKSVIPANSYISDYKIVSITGCVAVK